MLLALGYTNATSWYMKVLLVTKQKSPTCPLGELKPTVPFPIQAAGGTGAEFNRRFVRLGHTVDRPMRIVL